MGQGEPALILDIDSSSVGACIVESLEKPVVSHVKRVPVGSGEMRDASSLVPLLKEALTALLPEYAKAFPKLREVSVVVASPWYASTLRTLSSKSEKPVRVSQGSIGRIVKDHRQTEHEAQGKSTLEALPVTVHVNGYRSHVHKPVHGTTLSVTLYESVADQQFVATVSDAVHGVLPKAAIRWHTTPLAYAETLLRISEEDHATVVDVGGEVTDVIIISNQTVAFVASVPIGSRTIARSLSGKSGSLADSMSRLSMFARGELQQKEMVALAAELTTASKDWQAKFLAILAEAGNTVPVPHRVFVVGERDELPWFTQVVTGAETRGQRPLASAVGADFFAGLITYGEDGAFDASLALDAAFFHMRGHGENKFVSSVPVLYSVQ